MSTITPIQFVALCTLVVIVLACTALVLAIMFTGKAEPSIFGDTSGYGVGTTDTVKPQAHPMDGESANPPDCNAPVQTEPSPSFTDDIRRAMERKHFGGDGREAKAAMDYLDRIRNTTL